MQEIKKSARMLKSFENLNEEKLLKQGKKTIVKAKTLKKNKIFVEDTSDESGNDIDLKPKSR